MYLRRGGCSNSGQARRTVSRSPATSAGFALSIALLWAFSHTPHPGLPSLSSLSRLVCLPVRRNLQPRTEHRGYSDGKRRTQRHCSAHPEAAIQEPRKLITRQSGASDALLGLRYKVHRVLCAVLATRTIRSPRPSGLS